MGKFNDMRDALRQAVEINEKSPGMGMVTAERIRQFLVEGWTPEHDDHHTLAELASAAACYANYAVLQVMDVLTEENIQADVIDHWPWHIDSWKPAPDPIRNLEKAGALIIAEIDRLTRARGEV